MSVTNRKVILSDLRKKAEGILKKDGTKQNLKSSEADILKLIHELDVYQIELELQNEELIIAKNEAQNKADKYTELYDFAPTGYFTLSKEQKILGLNLIGAKMLGKTRSYLMNKNFASFLSEESKSAFNGFLEKLYAGKTIETCKLKLLNNPTILNIYVSGTVNETGEICFITATDVTKTTEAENAYIDSQTKLSSVIETSNTSIWSVDKNCCLLFGNSVFHKESRDRFGREIEIGENVLLNFLPTDEQNKWERDYNRALNGDKFSFQRERKFSKKFTWTEYFLAPITNGNAENSGVSVVAHNITELYVAEQELRKSEEKFKNIYNNLSVGISITQLDGFLSANKTFSHIVGYSEDELNGLHWQEITHPEDVQENEAIVKSILLGKSNSARWEKRYIHKKGNTVWVDISTVLQKDEDGNPSYFITSIIDITEKKKAENDLKEFKELFSLFMKHSPVYTFIKEVSSTESRVLQASDNFKELTGIPGSEMVGKTMEELFPPEFAVKITADDWEVVKNGIVLQLDEELNKKYYATIKFPIKRKGKNLLAGYTIDITERKKTEEALMFEQNRLRTLVDNLPDPIYVIDALGRKTIANPADLENIGAATELEVLGKTDKELFPGKTGEQCFSENMEVLKTGIPLLNKEESFEKSNGVLRWLLTSKVPLYNQKKEIVGLVGIGHDITERKKIVEELIKAKEKAEESDRLKSAFLANMSHEIRTPMNGILGFSNLLKEPHLTDEQQQKYIDIIEKSGERMLNTINDIIDISKIEAGLMVSNPTEFNINEKFDYIHEFFTPEAKRQNIQFLFNTRLPYARAFIQTDQEKFTAILTNLVKNALKYIESGTIEIGFSAVGKNFEFYVKDTGIGIEVDRQEAIFDRFIQADISDKKAFQGSGLGLTICKAYVEMLDGKMWLESEVGKGSTFYFTLPNNWDEREKNNLTTESDDETGTDPKALKILIVEDDPVSEMLLELMLTDFSSSILKARSGQKAIELCRQNPDLNVVFMDLSMPEMGGYETTRKIRRFNENVVIIAQTAFGLSGEEDKALEAGCNAYISKPLKKKIVDDVINKYFSGSE